MNFDELNRTIPYVLGTKTHVVTMYPYPGLGLLMPGKHQRDTPILGGDFAVAVTDLDAGWVTHKFTHTDIFKDIAGKADQVPNATRFLMDEYLNVVRGNDPDTYGTDQYPHEYTKGIFQGCGLNPVVMIHALQCLAVAEHRRYGQHEAPPKFGGRFLPFRFSAGIAEGLWTATDAIEKQRMGRGGVQWLEKDYGLPTLTKELFNG